MLPMTKAKYIARAVGVSFGESSKANMQVAVQCEIVEPANYAGETIAWLGAFTDKTTERTIESLQNMGWKGDDLSELEDLSPQDCARLLPDLVEVACEPDTYDGNTNLKVRWINKPGAGRFTFKEPVTGQKLKAFAAQMRGSIRGAQQGSRSNESSPRPTQTSAPAPRRGDPPF